MLASVSGHASAVALLLEHDAPINIRNEVIIVKCVEILVSYLKFEDWVWILFLYREFHQFLIAGRVLCTDDCFAWGTYWCSSALAWFWRWNKFAEWCEFFRRRLCSDIGDFTVIIVFLFTRVIVSDLKPKGEKSYHIVINLYLDYHEVIIGVFYFRMGWQHWRWPKFMNMLISLNC